MQIETIIFHSPLRLPLWRCVLSGRGSLPSFHDGRSVHVSEKLATRRVKLRNLVAMIVERRKWRFWVYFNFTHHFISLVCFTMMWMALDAVRPRALYCGEWEVFALVNGQNVESFVVIFDTHSEQISQSRSTSMQSNECLNWISHIFASLGAHLLALLGRTFQTNAKVCSGFFLLLMMIDWVKRSKNIFTLKNDLSTRFERKHNKNQMKRWKELRAISLMRSFIFIVFPFGIFSLSLALDHSSHVVWQQITAAMPKNFNLAHVCASNGLRAEQWKAENWLDFY